MSKLQKRYETRLETANQDGIIPILDAKLEATSPERVVDYVGFAVENLELVIERLKRDIMEYNLIISQAESQIGIIKSGTAEWLNESGVESLKGNVISSMKVSTPKAKEKLVITTDADELINQGYFKTSVDKTAIKNAIQSGIDVQGAEIQVEHQSDTLTVFHKRNK